ncbi:hypothetical protein [Fibrella aquatilis]|uniref:Auto-transporter adhesin head GIN domain-containing protein n=1 Tax=Fibrella aquatilis TaxID=2817059 RepID=A0A939G2H2_9BACT|nr:hypothetical protein [Fibrella aquatilis]MBO0931122.1 hypothetical protein [Fibrella aquatilis]
MLMPTAMRFIGSLFLIIPFLSACTAPPDADAIYDSLTNGQAKFIVTMNGTDFYPDESRFKGEVTIAPNAIRMNLFDQFESNVILTLNAENLFVEKPIKRTIQVDNQVAGSVMIGRVRDRKLRTGDGFVMTAGEVTIEALSDQKIVIRLSGKVGNFNTLRDANTWQRLEGLLVYKRPQLIMQGGASRSLLY